MNKGETQMKRINQIFERLAGSALKAAPLAMFLGGVFASSQMALAQVASPQAELIAAQPYLSAQPNAQLAQGPQLRGYYTVKPWDHGTGSGAKREAAESAGGGGNGGGFNGMFNYSITSSKDDHQYTGTMMGPSPWGPTVSALIPVVVVPLTIKIGTNIFDPTASNSCDAGVSAVSRFQLSPLVQTIPNLVLAGQNVGTTQWPQGFRRAEFWNLLTQIGYNPLYYDFGLSYTTATDVTVNTLDAAGKQHGTTYQPNSSGCSLYGIVSHAWLDDYLKSNIIPSLTSSGIINPAKFVIFLLRDVVQSDIDPPSAYNCCTLGYHSATGSAAQTYAVADWDTTSTFAGVADGSAAGHEIAEWMDDPLGTNATPAWGHAGQLQFFGQSNLLEVGDPLSEGFGVLHTYTMYGKTYHLQEEAFFSWFFNKNGDVSFGAGGLFSSNGTFSAPAKPYGPRINENAEVMGLAADNVAVCAGGPIIMDGSNVSLTNDYVTLISYFLSIQISDAAGNIADAAGKPYGPEAMRWLTDLDYITYGPIENFDVMRWAQDQWFGFGAGQHYRVKLATHLVPDISGWMEHSQVISIQPSQPPVSVLKINGTSGPTLDIAAPYQIVMDGSASACTSRYFLSIQLSDASWNRYGNEAGEWLTSGDFNAYGPINNFDVMRWAQDQWFGFSAGQYYRVKLAVGSPWNETTTLIHIK
jgi:hypothetical protein